MSRIQIENLMSSDLIVLDSQDSGKVLGGHSDDYHGFEDHGKKGEEKKKFYPSPYYEKYEDKYEFEYKYKPAKKYY
jgi:hypothetical protein